jgi:hypothetical protein
MDDPVKALHELADLTFEIGEDACHEREEIRQLTVQARLALMGNGDPANSVLGRLVVLEEKVTPLARDICDIKGLLTGGLTSSQPSMRQRMDTFEEYVKESKKMQWYILSAIIGYIVYQVLVALL